MVSCTVQVESKEMKWFFLQNLPQSTRRVAYDHLVSWGPSGLLFNCIFTDRVGANHGDINDSLES